MFNRPTSETPRRAEGCDRLPTFHHVMLRGGRGCAELSLCRGFRATLPGGTLAPSPAQEEINRDKQKTPVSIYSLLDVKLNK